MKNSTNLNQQFLVWFTLLLQLAVAAEVVLKEWETNVCKIM